MPPIERRRFPSPATGPALSGQLADRTVVLLDKLRRSFIHPFMLQTEAQNLSASVVTQLNSDDLKNEAAGPLVITRARIETTAAKAPGVPMGSPFLNLALRVQDNDHAQAITKTAAFMPALFSLDNNTWVLDHPHAISPRGSFSAFVTELAADVITDVGLVLLGDALADTELSAAEVQELIGLGLYPGIAGSGTGWARYMLTSGLLSDQRVCASDEIEALRWRLRERIAYLKLRLGKARARYTILGAGTPAAVPADGSSALPSDQLRNDTGWPMVVTRVCFYVGRVELAPVAGNRDDISVDLSALLHGTRVRLVWRPTIAALVCARATGQWQLDRPLVMGPGDSMEAKTYNESGMTQSFLYIGVHGQLLEGMSVDEVQEAVSLGLYGGWKPLRD